MGAICEELQQIATDNKFQEAKLLGEGGWGYCLKVTKDRASACVSLLFVFQRSRPSLHGAGLCGGSGLGRASKITILSAWHALMDVRAMHVTQTMHILRAGWYHARPEDKQAV